MSRRPSDLPPGRTPRSNSPTPQGGTPTRWVFWAVIGALLIGGVFFFNFGRTTESSKELTYSDFLTAVDDGKVKSVEFDPSNGNINGEFKQPVDGKSEFTSSGPNDDFQETTVAKLEEQDVDLKYVREGSNILGELLIWLLPLALIIGLLVWMNRRAQGQMGAVMNIGRSRAKVYNTEKPRTTFDDVAGYGPVKQEIAEVVDFLKNPGKFKEIGARIPKGVLLVGPPGTGKTLIARAVAGEAGVPFVSVTGSDFMEMFVGVGAARVRDLFQTARKQAPAIIFVDEIDSIGRKRGAGLGGGHDEREQTLNQMLAEMDGFEATEGIVMMAATNRPDVLDPALLRPGPLRPPDHGAAADPGRAGRDPEGALQGQEDRPGRRRQHHRPGHARHERRRPRQPRERGGAVRGAAGQERGARRGLRRGARPRASWASSASRWRSPRRRRRSSRTTRAATPCSATCSSTPTRCTR